MRVMVVGSGGREHALVWKLLASPKVNGVICAPGNAGTAALAQALPIEPADPSTLLEAARQHGADLTVVGPEGPLFAGIADLFESEGLKLFGPSQAAAEIGSNRVWAKELLLRHRIPTARAEVVESELALRAAISRFGYPVVIKTDGVPGGPRVWVARDATSTDQAMEALLEQGTFGTAERILVEEHLEGRELSVMAFTDGERVALMPPVRVARHLLPGDEGPLTDGMGGYSRPADATPELLAWVEWEIVRRTVSALAAEGRVYKGVLQADLMLTSAGPKVLEFHCSLGDPEAQLVLPLLESDPLETCLGIADGRFDPRAVQWGGGRTCGVVLAAERYPEEPKLGAVVEGLEDVAPGVLAFHGGTRTRTSSRLFGASNRVVTSGGRVVTVVATAPTLTAARELVYENVAVVDFDGKTYRDDIGVEPPEMHLFHVPLLLGRAATGAEMDESPRTVGTPEAEETPVPIGGRVVLLAPNRQERDALEETARLLEQLGVDTQIRSGSAFHAPAELERLAREASAQGVKAIIATAGSEPALAGIVAAWCGLPTIAIPLATDERTGAEQFLGASQVPDAVPVAVVAPGERGARVAAWLAASILGLANPETAERLRLARGTPAGAAGGGMPA